MADKTYKLTATLSTGEEIDCGTFTVPQGDPGAPGAKGDPGAAATVQVGTTTTGEPGTQASVENVGTSSAAVLNFTIPRGAGDYVKIKVINRTGSAQRLTVHYIDENDAPQTVSVPPTAISPQGSIITVKGGAIQISCPQDINMYTCRANIETGEESDFVGLNFSIAYAFMGTADNISENTIRALNLNTYTAELETACNTPYAGCPVLIKLMAPIELLVDPAEYYFCVGVRNAQ